MLVLSRKRDEVVKIGDDIEIAVVDIRGDKVRLGITAPKEVMVHRSEVYVEIRKENAAAAQAAGATDGPGAEVGGVRDPVDDHQAPAASPANGRAAANRGGGR